MKIVVFGGSGFLGSHVADVLTERGYHVTIFDLQPSPHLREGQEMVVGDIMESRAVSGVLKSADCVYNFAGVADIDEARINPLETIKQNILGNSIILDACRGNSVKRFLFASSVYVYSNSGSFYRTSKQASELIIENYQRDLGIDFTIMRYGSLYGTRADERNWIYSMLKQALGEGKITRKGDGEEIREYIHVRDAARLSVDLLDNKYCNQYIVISGNQAIKIKDLLIMIKEILNNRIKIEYVPTSHDAHYEITPYSFNPKIAHRILSDSYLDLGQGILDMLERIHRESSHLRKQDSVIY